MTKKYNTFQKKRKYKYTFIFWLVGIGVLLIVLAVYSNTIKEIEIKSVSIGGGTATEKKSFQPSDSRENTPDKLLWGRDF